MEKDLKENFINWFGIDKWNELEIISYLNYEQQFLSDLTNLEMIPVVFDELIQDNAIFDINEKVIILSSKLIKEGNLRILQTFLHEYRHYYQISKIKENPKKYEHWEYGLKTISQNIVDYYYNPLEIDAYAFAQVMMEYVYNVPYEEEIKPIQKVIEEYKRTNDLLDL